MSKLYIVPCNSEDDVLLTYRALEIPLKKAPKAKVVLILPYQMSADNFPNLQTGHNIALKTFDDLKSLTDNLDHNHKSLASFMYKMQEHDIKHNVGFVFFYALQINSYLNSKQQKKRRIGKSKRFRHTLTSLLSKERTQEESPGSSEEQSLEEILAEHRDKTYFVIAPAGLSPKLTKAILEDTSKEAILAYLSTAKKLVVDYTLKIIPERDSIIPECDSIDQLIEFHNRTPPIAVSEAPRSADAASSKKQPEARRVEITISLESECCLIPDSAVAFKLGKQSSACPVLSQFIAALGSSDLSEKQLKEASEDLNYYLNYFLAALFKKNGTIESKEAWRILNDAELSFSEDTKDIADKTLGKVELRELLSHSRGLLTVPSPKASHAVLLPVPQHVCASINKDNTGDIVIDYREIRHPSEDGPSKKPRKLILPNDKTLLLESIIGEKISDSRNTGSTASASSKPLAMRKKTSDLTLSEPFWPSGESTSSSKDDRPGQQQRPRSQSAPTILEQAESGSPKELRRAKSTEELLEELKKMQKKSPSSGCSLTGTKGIKHDVPNRHKVTTAPSGAKAPSKQAAGNSRKTRRALLPFVMQLSTVSEGSDGPNGTPQSPDSLPDGSKKLGDIKQQPGTEVDSADNKPKLPKDKKDKFVQTKEKSFEMDI